MNPEDYVSYPLALALKKVGFDYPCYFYYTRKDAPDDHVYSTTSEEAPIDYNRSVYAGCSMPTLAQAQKWLRERKKLHCQVLLNGVRSMYFWQIRELVGNGKHAESKHQYEIYEDAMNDCIAAALELIEKKGE